MQFISISEINPINRNLQGMTESVRKQLQPITKPCLSMPPDSVYSTKKLGG